MATAVGAMAVGSWCYYLCLDGHALAVQLSYESKPTTGGQGARANHLPFPLVVSPTPDGEGPAFDLRVTHARTLRPIALVFVSYGRGLVRVRALRAAIPGSEILGLGQEYLLNVF